MKSPFKIFTATAVAGALVAGGIVGAAPAFADGVPTPGTISFTASPIAIDSFGEPKLDVTINGEGRYLHVWSFVNGVWADVYQTYISGPYGAASTTNTIDIVAALHGTSYYSEPLAAGSYAFHFTTDADDTFTNNVETSYSAAQSPDVSLSVSKAITKISGFSTKTKKIKHGHYLGSKTKGDKFTVKNPGVTKIILQYKKKGGKWHNIDVNKTSSYNQLSFTGGYLYRQGLHNGKAYPRGTQYFRIVSKGTAFTTGATSKAFKFIVK